MTRLQILDFLFEHRRTEICLGSIFIRFTSIQYAFHEIKRSLRITWNTCKKKREKLIFRSLSLKILVFIIIEFQSSFFVSCQIGLRFELLDLQYAVQLGLLLMIFPIVCAKNETPIVYSGQSLVQYPQKPNATQHSLLCALLRTRTFQSLSDLGNYKLRSYGFAVSSSNSAKQICFDLVET